MKNPTERNDVAVKQETMSDKVSALFEIMKHEKIEELEISDAESHIHLKRKGHNVPQAVAVQSPSFVPVLPVEETASKQEYTGATVQSPIMGMLYRAPSPSSPPFVKEGDVVDIGKTLCIVEAMKVMNEIKADGRMKIIKILVENGKAITANQDLFQIERV